MKKPLVELKNVVFTYNTNQEQLLNIDDFKLYPGEKVGIIGHNGSGKSTIAKLILGIYTPQKGTVSLFGEKVLWNRHYNSVGYIGDPSHNPEELGLPIGFSVEEVINIFKNLLLDSQKETSSCEQLAKKLKLDSLLHRDVGKLSKGERMRLMAFLALGKTIKLLIADEATEGLDDEGKEILFTVLEESAKNQNFAILWISHRPEEIAGLTDQVYRLNNGKLNEANWKKFCYELEIIKGGIVENKSYSNSSFKSVNLILSKIYAETSLSEFKITGKHIK